jgi:hypothetical protein
MPARPRIMPPVGKAERGIVDQRDGGVDNFTQVVRRDIGRHADRDAAGAVDQEIGKLRRQHDRLAFRIVVVRLEVDGVFIDIVEQALRHLLEPHFGVSHGGGGIAVDRAEIALPVDQRHAHGEILRQPHHRVVNRLVAVRMIFTDDVANHARGLDVFLVRRVSLLVHRVQDAPVHGFQAVARIRQRTRHDHAHGVIEVAALHLVEDGYGTNI